MSLVIKYIWIEPYLFTPCPPPPPHSLITKVKLLTKIEECLNFMTKLNIYAERNLAAAIDKFDILDRYGL